MWNGLPRALEIARRATLTMDNISINIASTININLGVRARCSYARECAGPGAYVYSWNLSIEFLHICVCVRLERLLCVHGWWASAYSNPLAIGLIIASQAQTAIDNHDKTKSCPIERHLASYFMFYFLCIPAKIRNYPNLENIRIICVRVESHQRVFPIIYTFKLVRVWCIVYSLLRRCAGISADFMLNHCKICISPRRNTATDQVWTEKKLKGRVRCIAFMRRKTIRRVVVIACATGFRSQCVWSKTIYYTKRELW